MQTQDILWIPLILGTNLVSTVVGYYFAGRRYRRMRAYSTQLEAKVHHLVDVWMQAAEAEMDFADILQQMPKEFTPAVYKTLALAQTIPRAVLKIMRDKKLLTVDLSITPDDIAQAEATYKDAQEEAELAALPPPPPVPRVAIAPPRSTPPPSDRTRWEGDRLVPVRRIGRQAG